MPKKMKLEKVKEIIDQVNGVQVDSFSGLVAQLNRVPGIETIKFKDDSTGLLPVLAAMFDSSEIAGPQSITLEVKYPKGYCEDFDYEVGFRLGNKWAQLGHGWFSNVVRAINARTKSPKSRSIIVPTTILRSTVPPIS